jgi:hypothetical protein
MWPPLRRLPEFRVLALREIPNNVGLGVGDHREIDDAVDNDLERSEIVTLDDRHDGWTAK